MDSLCSPAARLSVIGGFKTLRVNRIFMRASHYSIRCKGRVRSHSVSKT